MNNLFNKTDVTGILARIETLTPGMERQWGKMNVSQMLAHCNASLETAMGLDFSERLGFIGRFFGKLLKPKYFSEMPFPKNGTTDKKYIIKGNPDFETEKAKAILHIQKFYEGGPAMCTQYPHAFFGELAPEEWAIMQWKHFDHHLRQFGA